MDTQFDKLVDDLVDAAYDSVHYTSAEGYEGLAERIEEKREALRKSVVSRLSYGFAAYQEEASRTANTAFTPARRFIVSGMGLAAEAGEVLSMLQKCAEQKRPINIQRVAEELGDCLWRIADICSALGLDMGEVARANIEKLEIRYPDGFTPKASIERKDVRA